ncbi:antA/AntB antirepressor family protein [Corynebacterium diphtheriae]
MANSAMSSHGGATELIPLTADTDGAQAVMGRDLHQFLEIGTAYSRWIERLIEKYGFIAGQDFLPKMAESTGGRPSEDHILTMDMAKEISMVQNNEKGKQARRYFIECERKAKTQHPAIPQTYAEALEAAATQARRAEELEAQQALNAPKVEYHDQFVADTDLIQFRTLANQINIGEQHLRQLLQKHGWIYDTPSERWSNKKQQKVIEHRWRCKADKKRYFHLVPNHTAPRINGEVRQTLKITPAGATAIVKALQRWEQKPHAPELTLV